MCLLGGDGSDIAFLAGECGSGRIMFGGRSISGDALLHYLHSGFWTILWQEFRQPDGWFTRLSRGRSSIIVPISSGSGQGRGIAYSFK